MIWKYILATFFVFSATLLSAQTGESDLQNKIDERNNQIRQLEEEIRQYNLEINNTSSQAKSLVNTIKTLDLTKKKIGADINLTQKKITNTESNISQLNREIGLTEDHINVNKDAVISALRNSAVLGDMSLIDIILSNKNLSDIWGEIDNINQIQSVIREKSKELTVLKTGMEEKQIVLGKQKRDLLNLKQDLSGKKLAVEYTTKEQGQLLSQTKNKEQTYKELVKTKEEQKLQFEREIYEYESQLHYLIDRNSYPLPQNGILSWPLENIFVTQKFGKTVGAEKLYASGTHNGVDFRASIGTKVKASLYGTVVGTGNTDIYPGCYSFGKWVMIRHNNGLSTIYAHLSVISVSSGQRLDTDDLVGFSGNTGYSTGPHLHISLYATQGVRIEKYVNSRGCKEATMPLADIRAYLDPLAYYPKL